MSSSISTEYKLPHEQGFLTALTKKHLKDKEKTFENLEYFQQFISDFINVQTPYRGVLINFGLGAGKTRTAIACTDSFLKAGFNIVFISPASLRTNFDIELENYQPSMYKGKQSELKERITYMSYNAGASFAKSDPQNKKNGSMDIEGILDNKIIIIDEVHTLVSNMVSALRVGRFRGISIYDKLMSAKNSRIVALSGTPIINYPYEVAILMNILSGYQNKDHTFYSGEGPKYTLFPDGHQHFDFKKKKYGQKNF